MLIEHHDGPAKEIRRSGYQAALDEVAALVQHLADAALIEHIGHGSTSTTERGSPDAAKLRQMIRRRQIRGKFFDADLLAEPAWDMLLDLAAARAEGKRVSVTSLCLASGVPVSTASRWIERMMEGGLLHREQDQADGGRVFLSLSDQAISALDRYFAASSCGGGCTDRSISDSHSPA